MEKACKVLVVLSDTQLEETGSYIRTCVNEFCTVALQQNMQIELVDLLSDAYKTRRPLFLQENNKTDKVIDYQMQLKTADWVVFFYQTQLGTMPGLLKSYLDVTMVPGVAYGAGDSETYLDHKRASVYVFEPKNQIEAQLYNANREDFFWNRMVFRTTGMKGEIKQFFNTENMDTNKLQSILHAIHTLIGSYRPLPV